MPSTPQGPVIGVSASSDDQARPYADVVTWAGGEPLVIVPQRARAERSSDLLAAMSGLIMTSGVDVNPRLYGAQADPEADLELDDDRDAIELPLLRAAISADMPVFCIGRGMQLLNVAMGGRLIQEIGGHSDREVDGRLESSYHHIYISPGSKLAAVVGSGGFVRVNSRHHQGIRDAQRSPQLLASAYSQEDGIIEALESPEHRWVIGVQFHPERRSELPPHFGRLFQSLVDRASERMSSAKSG